MQFLCFPSFVVEDIVEQLRWGSLFKISSLTAVFPSRLRIYSYFTSGDYLEGKVGFLRPINYFTAGADWLVIIFLILVNIAAQVHRGFYFGLCTQFIFTYYLYYILELFLNMCIKNLSQKLGSCNSGI